LILLQDTKYRSWYPDI